MNLSQAFLFSLILLIVVGLAGCSGISGDQSPTNMTVEATTSSEVTESELSDTTTSREEFQERDLDNVSYPPGASASGIIDPATLLQTHRQKLNQTTYRVQWEFSQIRKEYSDEWTFGENGRFYDIASNGTIISNSSQQAYAISLDYGQINQPDERHHFIFVNEALFHVEEGSWGAAWDIETVHPTVIPGRSVGSDGGAFSTGVSRSQQSETEESPAPFQTSFKQFHAETYGLDQPVSTVLHSEEFVAEHAVIRDGQTYILYRIESNDEPIGTLLLREDGLIRSVDVQYGEKTYLSIAYNDHVEAGVKEPSWADEARNDTVYFNQETLEQIREAAGDKDCADFATQAAAQAHSEHHDDGLDGDGDGIACEHLP